jgi:hypothetical protein
MSVLTTATGQLVMHPVVSKSLKIWATTLGRDKVSQGCWSLGMHTHSIYRLTVLSNTLRVSTRISFLLEVIKSRHSGGPLSKTTSVSDESVRLLLFTSTHFSNRKPDFDSVMRLGKPLEHLQAALKASQSAALSRQSTERFTAVARQLSYAGYLALDAVVWANSVKFINLVPTKADKVLRASLRFWFAGILFGLGNGLLKVCFCMVTGLHLPNSFHYRLEDSPMSPKP